MSTLRIFYSWQSDSPNNTNRGFILQALENAIKQLNTENILDLESVVDRDTLNVPGSPNIAATILDKINQAYLFVCDVSIITDSNSSRPSPNPNVLFELGYAVSKLGQDKVIMVLNRNFGGPEILPFDLRSHRVITYSMAPENTSKSPERRNLEQALKNSIRLMLPSKVEQSTNKGMLSVNQAQGLPSTISSNEITIRKIHQSYTKNNTGGGEYSIYGEIFNNINQIIYMPDVKVTFYNAADQEINVITGSGQRFCLSVVLYPNSSTPFHFYTHGPHKELEKIKRYKIVVTYSPRSNGWIEMPIEIQGVGPHFDKVIARNETDQLIQGARMIATTYNEDGNVNGMSEEYVGNAIYPGGFWEFTIRVTEFSYNTRIEGRSENL